jgi:hypothetical protein
MIRGCVLPHAPLLLELEGRVSHPSPSVVSASRSVDLGGDLVVICSTHGDRTGVYTTASGDLGGFGLDLSLQLSTDPVVAKELAESWGRPLLDADADHGVTAALLGAGAEGALVVACCIPYDGDFNDDVATLTSALVDLAEERALTFVASAHGSASATPRAPLTERPEGKELDTAIFSALRDGPEALLDIPLELWERAGSCGAPPLRVLGGLGLGPANLLAYDAPVGVGYLVATCP